jgi:hypothetical protein
VGGIYRHIYGWTIKVIATGQRHSGDVVFIAEVLDGQPFGGQGPGSLISMPVSSAGWSRIADWNPES